CAPAPLRARADHRTGGRDGRTRISGKRIGRCSKLLHPWTGPATPRAAWHGDLDVRAGGCALDFPAGLGDPPVGHPGRSAVEAEGGLRLAGWVVFAPSAGEIAI